VITPAQAVRLRQDTVKGWLLTCDLCGLREAYHRFWIANRSLRAHVKMHEEETP
jgi:hypothetical protein